MSTKKESTSSINYDPTAMSAYKQNINTAMPILQQFAQNPTGNPFFNSELAQGNKQAAQAGQRNMQNIMNNAKIGGMGGNSMSPFLQSQIAAAGRGTSGLQQQSLWGALNNANARQMSSLGMMSGFQPLMTGSNTVEKTSGTGTWLPQVIGAGLSAAAAFGTGGASLAAQGAAKTASSVGSGGASMLGAGSGLFSGGGVGGGGGGGGSSFWGSSSPQSSPAFNPFSFQY